MTNENLYPSKESQAAATVNLCSGALLRVQNTDRRAVKRYCEVVWHINFGAAFGKIWDLNQLSNN